MKNPKKVVFTFDFDEFTTKDSNTVINEMKGTGYDLEQFIITEKREYEYTFTESQQDVFNSL